MRSLTVEELEHHHEQLLAEARKGQACIVMEGGDPVLVTLPLGRSPEMDQERLELAVAFYECNLISIGLAAKVAGRSYSQMADELSRRRIPIARYDEDDLERELAHVRSRGGGG